jgi:hypothetical protein
MLSSILAPGCHGVQANNTLNKPACIPVVVETYDPSGYADATVAGMG